MKSVLIELKNCKLIAEVLVLSDHARWIRMVLEEVSVTKLVVVHTAFQHQHSPPYSHVVVCTLP